MHLLIVEDDPRIASFVDKGLRAEGYTTSVATTAADALAYLDTMKTEFDLVLLDIGLPDESGLSVLERIRQVDRSLPVIILTARATVREKVAGLDLGANDYVTKPFAFEELVARIRAALRTADQPSASQLVVGDLRLDLLAKFAWRAGRLIELAPREWALLELFMRHPNHVLSRARILSAVWDYSFEPGSNVVDVYVGYLRRKVDLEGLPPMIQTVRGAGYRLVARTVEAVH
ncbi:MAG TPA: response regulator transcription factor [Acidimicrobiales bacterium]|nr:response regulator transcription factor [Acidimicrobiales bacterium]